MRAPRGFTIAETMVVALILGILLMAVAGSMTPLFAAPARAQAKTESLGAATAGLYVLERDLRESHVDGVFACTGEPAQCGDGALGVSDSAIVLPTALASGDLGAQFVTTSSPPNPGSPQWQGFIIYWQTQPGGDVYRTYEPQSGLTGLLDSDPPNRAQLQSLAEAAAATAATDPSPSIIMHGVATLSALVERPAGVTALHVVAAGSASGHTNTTTFDDDIFARN